MEDKKNIGIWMDHSEATLIDLKRENTNPSIHSKFTTKAKEEVLNRSEYTMHNKEQQMHEAYYKKIANEVLKYDHILLFGPTEAKTELHNYLNKDLHFEEKIIEVKSGEKMTGNEKIAFVKNHFNN